MRLFVDTEYNGGGGELISLALVIDADNHRYIVREWSCLSMDLWVIRNVIPSLGNVPKLKEREFLNAFVEYLVTTGSSHIEFIYTSREDERHLRELVRVASAKLSDISFSYNVYRKQVDVFRTTPDVKHNALSDAICLYKQVVSGEVGPNKLFG